MSDIFKYDLESGKKFSNDAGEAETKSAYEAMMEAEANRKAEEMLSIKETLSESKKAQFEALQSNLLESLLEMKKFMLKNDLRSEEADKFIGEAEEACVGMTKVIVESIVKA